MKNPYREPLLQRKTNSITLKKNPFHVLLIHRFLVRDLWCHIDLIQMMIFKWNGLLFDEQQNDNVHMSDICVSHLRCRLSFLKKNTTLNWKFINSISINADE